MLRSIWQVILILLPLLAFVAPLPFADQYSNLPRTLGVVLILYLALFTLYLGARSGRLLYINRQIAIVLGLFSLVLPALVYFFLLYFKNPHFILGLLLLLASIFLYTLLDRSNHSARGFLSLFVMIAILLSVEATLRGTPTRYFKAEVLSVPALAESERSEAVYERNGFRGKRPCTDCPTKPLRIFTMGGSSTYGLPMYHSIHTYAEGLQRLLNDRRPGESYEVLNAGIAGHGITQVLHSIEASVLEHQPDIISVMSWFNDSAPGPGWWGVHGKSDRDAYIQLRVLWALQDWSVYRKVQATRLYGVFRFYTLKGWKNLAPLFMGGSDSDQKHPTRMSPEEFGWALEEIVKLGEKHDFLPVLILEPLHRTHSLGRMVRSNEYYRVITGIAEKYDLPLVDPVTQMHSRRDEWLFYDFIHPNIEGHRIIAEQLYDTLFEQSSAARDFLAGRGVDLSLPAVRSQYREQVDSKLLSGRQIIVGARAPLAKEQKVPLNLFANGQLISASNYLTSSAQEFSLELPAQINLMPLVDLIVEAGAIDTTDQPEYQIGTTQLYSPQHISVTSGGRDYGWTVEIRVGGRRYDPDTRGYNIVVLGANSGSFVDSAAFDLVGSRDRGPELIAYLKSLSQYTNTQEPLIVIVAVHTDGAHNIDHQELGELLKSFGGSGNIPGGFESYALIGTPGASVGSGVEAMGPKLVQLEIGSEEITRARLVELNYLNYP